MDGIWDGIYCVGGGGEGEKSAMWVSEKAAVAITEGVTDRKTVVIVIILHLQL